MTQWVVLVVSLVVSVGLWAAPTKLDLNNDGVMESIYCYQTPGGNNLWLDVCVKQGKKIVFQEKGLCEGIESYSFLDIDPRFKGKEIIVWRRSESYESGGRTENSFYAGRVYRWSEAAKIYTLYVYYETHAASPTGAFPVLDAKIVKDFPVYLDRWDKASQFCQALAKKDWETAQKLIDPLPDAAPITLDEAKLLANDCAKFPTPLAWQVYTSPHDPDYICFVIKIPKNVYTIVTNSGGINKMASGDFD